jgi:hypothetical protein
MEKADLKRIELLLQVIADELYVARTDREFEEASSVKGWHHQAHH